MVAKLLFCSCIIFFLLALLQPNNAYHIKPMRSLIRVKSFFGLFESSQSVCNDGVGSSDCCETNTASSNTFVVNKLQAEVSQEEISDENLVKIVNLEATDQQCNDLLWKCLGYTYNSDAKNYDNINVFPKWREQYPDPPDVIGITRQYHVEVDKSVRDASVRLVRSIPLSFKGGVRSLESKGFKGYKLAELTPNKTRRAQMVNWLIYYREVLFGKSLSDLINNKKIDENPATNSEEMKPSEKQFEKHRLDLGA